MRLQAGLAVALLCAASAAQAEFRAALGSWRYELSGFVTDAGDTFDFEDDLGLEASGRRSLELAWDTPPGWPDLAASYAQLGARGFAQQSTSVTIGPIVIPGPTRTLDSRGDFNDFDVTLRWPLALGKTRLALGIVAKRLSGDIVIDDSEESEPREQKYDETVPLLHAQWRWPLGRVLALTATVQGLEYQGSSATELRAVAELRLFRRLLLEAGWQEKRYRIDLDDYRLDARLDGTLLRAGFLLD